MTALLELENVSKSFGSLTVTDQLSYHLDDGEALGVIGPNGAGKSTFLRSITGLLGSAADSISFEGTPIGAMPANDIVKLGIAMVPEGRKLFPSLTVAENLQMGGYSRRKGYWNIECIYELFPVLRERRNSPGTALSGGQQQMVAIGRALMSNPRLLLCDEISLGLAPIIIKDIYAALPAITGQGTTVVVVEQDIAQAMEVADRIYCFQEGRVSLEGRPDQLSRDQITAAYFGV